MSNDAVTADRDDDRGIDAVIFDFAGVLSSSPGAMMLRQIEHQGIDVDLRSFMQIVLGPLETDSDHPWHRLERGQISFDDYMAAIEPLWRDAGFSSFPSPPRSDDVLAALTPVPEMIEAARALRSAGYRTAILTNNTREWGAWREAWDADNLVDVVVDSCQVDLRKPNPAIFELTVELLGGPPIERCLFLDDFPWNVAAADAMGFRTMQVADPVVAAADLLRLLNL